MIAIFRRILRRILALVAFVVAAAAVTSTAAASAQSATPNCFTGVHDGVSPACGGDPISQAPPAVTQQPAATTVTEGSTAYFTAAGRGTPSPTIQWFYSTDEGVTWSSALQYTPTFELDGVAFAQNNFLFEAVFTNQYGTATTWSARLSVTPLTRAAGVSPAGVDFGAVPVGNTSIVQAETVTNTGDAPLPITDITTSDPQFVVGRGSCAGASLAPGQSCSVTVWFAPSGLGEVDGTLTITDPADAGPQTVTLTGTGADPARLAGGGLAVGGVNEPFRYDLRATGFPTPSVALTAGALPPGLSLDPSGLISGAPTKSGYYTAQFVATNDAGSSAATTLHIKVLPKVTLTVAPAGIVEGNAGITYLVFHGVFSRTLTSAATFDVKTVGGTATSGSDFQRIAGTQLVPDGASETDIQVPIYGDRKVEPDEQFTLALSKPVGVVLGTRSAVGTIVNDD